MPELPEVATIVRQLQQTVVGKRIKAVEVRDKKVVDKAIPKAIPSTIRQISRRGKYILVHLDNGNILLTHLRMSGHFQYQKEPGKYTSAIFHFQDGSMLTFNEIRKFGRMTLVKEKKVSKILSSLGPEPLACSYPQFQSLLQGKKRSNIKTTLLDQGVLAGLGNIYAQEALYHAKIKPQRAVGTIKEKEIKKLHSAVQSTLRLAIKHCGTTIENYTSLEGSGNFQRFLAVYGQEKCPKKHPLQKIKIGGRGTWWCGRCQK